MTQLTHYPIVAALSLFLCCFQASADDAPDTTACTGEDANTCLENAIKSADDAMTRLYRAIMKKLDQSDDRARLREAQRAWVAFRDKSCLYEVGPNDRSAGSVSAQEQLRCLERYTKQRADQLQGYLARCEEHGC